MQWLQQTSIDLLFPVQCIGCARYDQWLCQDCIAGIFIADSAVLAKGCQRNALHRLWVVGSMQQPILASAIHAFKYQGVTALGEVLGSLLIQFLRQRQKANPFLAFDCVVPVPLSRQRQRWRGYNQSEILAERVSTEFGWRLESTNVNRRYQLLPQVGLSAADRQHHVVKIFSASDPAAFRGKNILLIDDVVTSGATLNECAKTLRRSGARTVWGLAVARG